MEFKHSKSKTVAKIYANLEPMLKDNINFDDVVDVIDLALTEWKNSVVDQLVDKRLFWDKMNEGSDETLYTLGLRQAIDLIENHDSLKEDES
jgi:acid phosphatase class B